MTQQRDRMQEAYAQETFSNGKMILTEEGQEEGITTERDFFFYGARQVSSQIDEQQRSLQGPYFQAVWVLTTK